MITARVNEILLSENHFIYDKKKYKYDEIKSIKFYYSVTDVKLNFQHSGYDHQADCDIYLNTLKKPIRIRTGGYLTYFTIDDTKRRAEAVLNLYYKVAEKSFQLRLSRYLSEMNTNGYFTYDNKRFYPDGRAVSPKFTLDLKNDRPIFKKSFWLYYKTQKNLWQKFKNYFSGNEDFYIYMHYDKDVFVHLLKTFYNIE